MLIREEKKNGVSLLHIEGDMTIYTAAELKAELMKRLEKPVELEINLSAVSEMDSAGLQLLLLAKREALRHGTPLRLSWHSRAVLDVLDMCNLTAYFGDTLVINPQ
jgi:anti-sigma B factor antagonist